MLNRYGMFFLFLLSSSFAYAYPEHPLEKIVIYKPQILTEKYVLREEEFRNSSLRSIPEALGLLGIDTQNSLQNYGIHSDFSFRGLSFEGLTILLNGERVNDPQTGHHNSDIPLALDDVNSIELDSLKG
ncbi:MAG: Plug domain-containing protein, partial [Candidatus Omnitrophica bacterium]|nr:Plug domain-containing protein [Candidatus Omnitrophota bacterium]